MTIITNNQIIPATTGRIRQAWLPAILTGMFLVLLSATALAAKINLNTADAEALQYIPGIGPGKAEEIIALRKQTGGFKTFDQLLDVPGIGSKTLEIIRMHGALEEGVSSLTDEMRDNPPSQEATESSASTDSGSGTSG